MNKYLLGGLHNSGISLTLQNKTKKCLLAEDFTPCLQSDVISLIYLITILNYMNTTPYTYVVKTNTAWRL